MIGLELRTLSAGTIEDNCSTLAAIEDNCFTLETIEDNRFTLLLALVRQSCRLSHFRLPLASYWPLRTWDFRRQR